MIGFIETLGQSLTVGLLILVFGVGLILTIGIILDTIEGSKNTTFIFHGKQEIRKQMKGKKENET